ncbi:sugar transferase [Actinocrispum wychmicini]|uniref:Undecaprenyl-phosphate galactose phosphotransferase WbaP/exopolysaccharide biosynthesis polyprenyl glycosylphosphotransferase n=1 Tax=Actinocrispum wychmicini TaxID=1213861 RepID=A0A4R2JX68_9PSEU|nr:sugar transferase [Actinocrispum wychmicini]TCO65141.1 Undecaprenyl-phosphate galactose phosphotransferase WbaP/exopolysaccharide biosynthesis polyprenyl glycosylphosphotransferase [Actinocrispum wychmicini]
MGEHASSTRQSTHRRRNVESFGRAVQFSEPGHAPIAAWEPKYRRSVVLSDLLATVVAVGATGLLFGAKGAASWHQLWVVLGVTTVALVLCSLWMNRAWSANALGQGADEFGRLGRGLFSAAVVLALGGLALESTNIRLWVFVAIPAIALFAFPMRYALRRLLHKSRREGRCLLPVLVAGSVETARDLIARTRSAPHLGWRIEAVCTFDGRGDNDDELAGVPVVGRLRDLAEHVRRGGYRVVAIASDPYWTPRRLQELAWNLEGSEAEMVVAPVLMEVAGPRLHVSGVLGMPLLRVSAPVFSGARRVVKEIVDRVGSALLLTVFSPLVLAISLLIVLDSRGSVFYRQQRVGKDGRSFTMVKFRTMIPNADKLRSGLANEGHGLLFKMRTDPRVTRVGAVLRRYSLDELPQLFNVLSGSMSLVGPRPPLPEESERYTKDVRRRLLVKPGMTGLWQVSGRSDLPWEESVRLDLRYVEDWSLTLDAVIMWKTVRAVVTGQGAY